MERNIIFPAVFPEQKEIFGQQSISYIRKIIPNLHILTNLHYPFNQ